MDKTTLVKINSIATMAAPLYAELLTTAREEDQCKLDDMTPEVLQAIRGIAIDQAARLYGETIVAVATAAAAKAALAGAAS